MLSGTKMGPLMKVIPYETVPFQFRTGTVLTQWIRTLVDLIPKGSERSRSRVNVALNYGQNEMRTGQHEKLPGDTNLLNAKHYGSTSNRTRFPPTKKPTAEV